MMDIETRLRRIEALDNIRRVIYTYAEAGDRHNAADTTDRIFTEDAIWETKGVSKFQGRQQIVEGLAEIGRSQVTWSFHLPGRILIELNSSLKAATANWLVWEPATLVMQGTAKPHWLAGSYDATLVQVGANWKFSSLALNVKFFTPYEGPWTQIESDFEFPA